MSILKTIFKWIGTLLLAVLIVLLVWGVGIEPRFILETNEYEAELPNLPLDWQGQEIALLADFQLGMWLDNEGMVEGAIASAVLERPGAVLIAGDFVYKPDSAQVRRAVNFLRPLVDAGIPTVVVLGNHDYSLMKRGSTSKPSIARYLRGELEAAGVTVLQNEARAIYVGGDTTGGALYVAGIGSEWAGAADPAQALAGVPEGAARVVLMHNPASYRDLAAGSAPLTLAAHTHGGQIRVFGEHTSWLGIAEEGEVVADGWAADDIGAAGNRLYVNRGLGFSTVPIRVSCSPELTLFTLRLPSEE